MLLFPENACVQRSARAAIYKIMGEPCERTEQDNAGRSGCVQSVLLAMRIHKADSNIVRITMGTVARLIMDNRSNARRLVKFNGLAELLVWRRLRPLWRPPRRMRPRAPTLQPVSLPRTWSPLAMRAFGPAA
jgi:hypothetical protein